MLEVDGANGIKDVLRNGDFGIFSNEWGYRIDGYSVNNNGETQISPHNYTYQRKLRWLLLILIMEKYILEEMVFG